MNNKEKTSDREDPYDTGGCVLLSSDPVHDHILI